MLLPGLHGAPAGRCLPAGCQVPQAQCPLPAAQGPKRLPCASGRQSSRLCAPSAVAAPDTLREAPAQVAPEQRPDIEWKNLGFGVDHVAPHMYRSQYMPGVGWQGSLEPYGPLQLDPAAQVLNYGQGIFEGMKAQRTDGGKIVLFRPEENAARMQAGAARLLMPEVPAQHFAEALMSLVAANHQWVPPAGRGSLYLRPLLLGTGSVLGLGPAPSYTFLVFAAAVGAYFKTGQSTPINLIIEERFHRAAPGGMGGTKAVGNYSPVLLTQTAAKEQGFADVVYLDARTDTFLEEVSSCNIFVRKGRTLRTPALTGTILPGVTRKSIMQLAELKGYSVEETNIPVAEAMEADEIFTTGTAVVVQSVGSLTHKGRRKQFCDPADKPGELAQLMYDELTGIQLQQRPDPNGWVREVPLL